MICLEEWILFTILLVGCFLSAYIGWTTRCTKEREQYPSLTEEELQKRLKKD